MSSLSSTEARSQIVELLSDTVYQALGLKETLEEERKALETQNLDDINTTVGAKSTCVEQLRVLDQKRIQFCNDCGFSSGPDQMQQLMEWCDDSDLIRNRWEHLLIIAAESSALNMTNGAIIRVRQQQFESSLSLLRGVKPGSDTYGPRGGESGDYGRQSLAEA